MLMKEGKRRKKAKRRPKRMAPVPRIQRKIFLRLIVEESNSIRFICLKFSIYRLWIIISQKYSSLLYMDMVV